ncbi:MAG: hypothetical protein GW779_02330 [Candidatus Altiarchaeum hamiconexum]|uniref:Uncharacterized protein n=1 Tax=Candidatus Altarchaeum hamiconexum TaxID=1803513 RepID=A0A8J8CKB9_9ARCH|nr:hypothetical protein [Candidatus Altarchaeum hamiconexum]NCS91247.1 hypothetical protein [Candidatus Altarchaeum hamiconexum]NCT00510.1 hypothetical protein [Candidatus Altarchaeum hamiconexum]
MDQKIIKVKVLGKIIVKIDTFLDEIMDGILFVKLKSTDEYTIVVLQPISTKIKH